jgi:hypothetical protein
MKGLMSKLRLFYIDYTRAGKSQVYVATVATPVAALDRFHTHQQIDLQHKPTDYKILRLYFEYHAERSAEPSLSPEDWNSTYIQSDFDLPQGPNPVLVKDKAKPTEEETAFSFYKDTPVRNKSKR